MEKYFGLAKELLDKGLARESYSYDKNNTYDTAIKFTDDLAFYVELAKKQGGKVLDIGCGTGRVLLPLLEAGVDAVGMDLSSHMLKLAAGKLAEAGYTPDLHEGDMRDFSLPHEFALIIIPYYSMIYLHSDEDRARTLACCYQHLCRGGILAFDFDAGCNKPGLSSPWLGFEKVESQTGQVIVQTAQMNQVDEHLRIVDMITYRLKGAETSIDVNASVESSIPVERMKELIETARFTVQGFYKDYSYTPYDGGEECLAVAMKR